MGCHLLLIAKDSGLGWSLNNPCSFMILGLNFACFGDQPQKVSCCLLSLLVLFRFGFNCNWFSFDTGLNEVEEVEDLRFRPTFTQFTSTSMTIDHFWAKKVQILRKNQLWRQVSRTHTEFSWSWAQGGQGRFTAGKSTLWCSSETA